MNPSLSSDPFHCDLLLGTVLMASYQYERRGVKVLKSKTHAEDSTNISTLQTERKPGRAIMKIRQVCMREGCVESEEKESENINNTCLARLRSQLGCREQSAYSCIGTFLSFFAPRDEEHMLGHLEDYESR